MICKNSLSHQTMSILGKYTNGIIEHKDLTDPMQIRKMLTGMNGDDLSRVLEDDNLPSNMFKEVLDMVTSRENDSCRIAEINIKSHINNSTFKYKDKKRLFAVLDKLYGKNDGIGILLNYKKNPYLAKEYLKDSNLDESPLSLLTQINVGGTQSDSRIYMKDYKKLVKTLMTDTNFASFLDESNKDNDKSWFFIRTCYDKNIRNAFLENIDPEKVPDDQLMWMKRLLKGKNVKDLSGKAFSNMYIAVQRLKKEETYTRMTKALGKHFGNWYYSKKKFAMNDAEEYKMALGMVASYKRLNETNNLVYEQLKPILEKQGNEMLHKLLPSSPQKFSRLAEYLKDNGILDQEHFQKEIEYFEIHKTESYKENRDKNAEFIASLFNR